MIVRGYAGWECCSRVVRDCLSYYLGDNYAVCAYRRVDVFGLDDCKSMGFRTVLRLSGAETVSKEQHTNENAVEFPKGHRAGE